MNWAIILPLPEVRVFIDTACLASEHVVSTALPHFAEAPRHAQRCWVVLRCVCVAERDIVSLDVLRAFSAMKGEHIGIHCVRTATKARAESRAKNKDDAVITQNGAGCEGWNSQTSGTNAG